MRRVDSGTSLTMFFISGDFSTITGVVEDLRKLYDSKI
jgi:hypothetical protein